MTPICTIGLLVIKKFAKKILGMQYVNINFDSVKAVSEHRLAFHCQNAAALDCLFVSIPYMTLLSHETSYHYQNAAALDCLFVFIKSLSVL